MDKLNWIVYEFFKDYRTQGSGIKRAHDLMAYLKEHEGDNMKGEAPVAAFFVAPPTQADGCITLNGIVYTLKGEDNLWGQYHLEDVSTLLNASSLSLGAPDLMDRRGLFGTPRYPDGNDLPGVFAPIDFLVFGLGQQTDLPAGQSRYIITDQPDLFRVVLMPYFSHNRLLKSFFVHKTIGYKPGEV
jgi:hypothetical protein